MKFDVLIVGGGPAGLSAALILGRCHRKALLCDEGHQRNLSSHAIHGLLGREGRSPSAFVGEARQELSFYKSISVRGTRVTDMFKGATNSSLRVRTAQPAALQRSCLRRVSLTSFLN
jgi:thioredoxin reductase